MAKSKKKEVEEEGEAKISLNSSDINKILNKKAGREVSFDLTEDNPTKVSGWIPTGSRWLDSIISKGELAGIPIGKISEIAGLESTGKSYMAAQIASNAQKMGMRVVYFDSESAIDPDFLESVGCDVKNLNYVQASSVEFVLESIETITSLSNRTLFIWDSLAFCPSNSDVEGDFNPQSSMAVKPRVLSKGMSKLLQPLANTESSLLILNQLKTNITKSVAEALTTPYFTPGGKAVIYAYSLRIWLTGRKAKDSFVTDDRGYRIGSEVKAKLEKSRFGTQGRACTFKILWGSDSAVIQDKESWLEAIKPSEHLITKGSWYYLTDPKNEEKVIKFQKKEWLNKLEDQEFFDLVISIMDEEVVCKFDKKLGNAEQFYSIPEE